MKNASTIQDTVEIRFWSKVNIRNLDECWLWTGSLTQKGYGQFSVGRKKFRAHRFIYTLKHGTLPCNIEVCHTCDNRSCCNLRHLYPDTHKGNMQDAIRKGRFHYPPIPFGETHHNAKLNNYQVIQIRKLRANKTPYKDICNRFNISRSLVQGIVKRKTWKHVK